MSDADLDDDFDGGFDDEDAKKADEAESGSRSSGLEKRRMIDDLLAQKRLEKELKDDLDDLGDDDDFDDFDDDDFDDE